MAARDDAGVFQLTPELALVQSVDFFTPVVDDPYTFGQIAAVNALSDVYTMGARPVCALNVAGFPSGDDPGPEVLARILQGGVDILAQCGVALLGGHTIDDPEPKYGLAVTGVVHPDKMRTKAGARSGDRLVLTKPIGIGAITTAMKRGMVTDADAHQAVLAMLRLNDQLAALAHDGVHAVTDVTGFGLVGHLLEMCRAGGVGAVLRLGDVPVLPAAPALVAQGIVPAGSRRNLAFVRPHLAVGIGVSEADLLLLADAVTSGGLLLAVDAAVTQAVCAALLAEGALMAKEIGFIVEASAATIRVDP